MIGEHSTLNTLGTGSWERYSHGGHLRLILAHEASGVFGSTTNWVSAHSSTALQVRSEVTVHGASCCSDDVQVRQVVPPQSEVGVDGFDWKVPAVQLVSGLQRRSVVAVGGEDWNALPSVQLVIALHSRSFRVGTGPSLWYCQAMQLSVIVSQDAVGVLG